MAVRRQQIVDGDAEAIVELDGVAVDDTQVLGEPGGGAAVVDWLVTRGTIGPCALPAGLASESLQLTAIYAKGRVQFERLIATFQAWDNGSRNVTSTSR